MIFETIIDNLRDIMDSNQRNGFMETSLQIMTRAIIDYIIRTLVKTDEATFNQREEYQLQLTSSLSGFLELVMLMDNDEEILDWLGKEDNWRDCFLICSDPSLLDADIFWSITKALCVLEDTVKENLPLTSESITSSLHHIIICFATLFERQSIDPESVIELLNHTTISACYGDGNGKKPLEGWEQKEMLSKFFTPDIKPDSY